MTDLEFYQKALMFQSYLVGKIAQTETYKSNWSDIFCLKEIREAFQKY